MVRQFMPSTCSQAVSLLPRLFRPPARPTNLTSQFQLRAVMSESENKLAAAEQGPLMQESGTRPSKMSQPGETDNLCHPDVVERKKKHHTLECEGCTPYEKWIPHEADGSWEPYDSPDPELGLRALGRKYQNTLGKVRCVLIDLAGTLHVGNQCISGGQEGIALLRKFQIPYRFVTNTTKDPKRVLVERLRKMGFPVEPDEVMTSLTEARKLIEKEGLRPYFLIEDVAMEDFKGISQDSLNSVCVGLAPSKLDYLKLNEAFRILHNGSPLIGIHAGRYQRDPDGGLSLGPGAFIKTLEYAASVKAVIVGKPTRRFFSSVVESLGCKMEEAVMIGDDVRDDVGGAIEIGMKGILVRTGKFTIGDEKKILPLKPTMIAKDFNTAVRAIIGAICLDKGVPTTESSDEDEEGYLVKTQPEVAISNQDLKTRVQARVNLNACPKSMFCTETYNPFKDTDANEVTKPILMKDFIHVSDIPFPRSSGPAAVGFPFPYFKKRTTDSTVSLFAEETD